MIKKVAVLFLILNITAYAGGFGNLKEYFAQEEHPDTILHINGYAYLNFIGGFADGNYKLKSYSILPYAKNIYILNLVFEKKKHYFKYIKRFNVPFFYNSKIIAFKTVKGKKIYNFQKSDIEIIKTRNGWKIIKRNGRIKAQLPVMGGYLFLVIEKSY